MYEQNIDYKVKTGKGLLVSCDRFKTVKLVLKLKINFLKSREEKVQGIPN